MQASEVPATHYVRGASQLWIPPYQRPYRWNSDQWIELWRDFAIQYEKAKFPDTAQNAMVSHFMGSLIIEQKEMLSGSSVSRIAIIDGQQRLLTFFALLAAMRDQQAFDEGRRVTTENSLATIFVEHGENKDRVVMERSEGDTLGKLLRGEFANKIPWIKSDNLLDAYIFFRRQAWVGELSLQGADAVDIPKIKRIFKVSGTNILDVWNDLDRDRATFQPILVDVVFSQGLKLLEILLQSSDEEASIIFETMNSRGTQLLQFDQLRSSIWVALPIERTEFHVNYWLPGEKVLSSMRKQSSRATEEQFFYEYLIGTGIGRTTFRSLHKDFMQQAFERVGYPLNDEHSLISKILLPMSDWAHLYPMAQGLTSVATTSHGELQIDEELVRAIGELHLLGGAPFHPLVLIVLDDLMKKSGNAATDWKSALEAIESLQSYVVRYMLIGEPLSPMRSMTMRIAESISNTGYSLSKLKKALHAAGWLPDSKILKNVKETELYNYGSSTVFPIFRGIEKQMVKRGEHPMPFGNAHGEYSIEHIFPQRSETSTVWIEEVATWGSSLISMQERTHVLGNLTPVTNYDNKKNARKKLSVKQSLIERCAPLSINKSFLDAADWSTKTIDDRSIFLATKALERWTIS